MFMFSRNKKSPSKKAAVVEEKPLYAQLLPFANVMTEKVQVGYALTMQISSRPPRQTTQQRKKTRVHGMGLKLPNQNSATRN